MGTRKRACTEVSKITSRPKKVRGRDGPETPHSGAGDRVKCPDTLITFSVGRDDEHQGVIHDDAAEGYDAHHADDGETSNPITI